MKKVALLAASAACLALAPAASAAVVIQQSSSFVMPEENVQLDTDITPGDNILRGTTNQTSSTVVFRSTSDDLLSSPQGQAKIEPIGTGANDGLGNLSFSLENGSTFTSAEFNILASVGGMVTLTAFDAANMIIQSVTNPLIATVDASGQNFFGFLADSSTPISSITIQALGGTQIASVGQFRVGGISTAGAVPEPATWAMMLFGFGILGASMRRKARATVRGRVRFA